MAADYKKYEGGEIHQGDGRDAPYPVSRLAPHIELVDLAKQIAHADNMLTSQAEGKLRLIAEQIKALQEQAHKLLEDTQQAQELHRARCNFKKIPGKIYHLYQQEGGGRLFSMLSPAEWGGKPPYLYIGSYYLENDMSWTSVEEQASNSQEDAILKQLLKQLGADR